MKKRIGAWLLVLLASLSLHLARPVRAVGAPGARLPAQAEDAVAAKSKKKKKNTPTPSPRNTAKPTPKPTARPTATPKTVTPSPVPAGPIIEPQAIADWLFSHDFTLPDNFITKREAQDLGWGTTYRYVDGAAPGCSIGGDRFGNREGLLPTKKGRQYYECDCWYEGGPRNGYRIVFSNDGLVFYTDDHYQTFTEMHPSTVTTRGP